VALIAAWFSVRSIVGAQQIGGGQAALWTTVTIVVGAALVVAGVHLWSEQSGRASLRAFAALAERFPDGDLYRILGFTDFRIGINVLRGARPYPLAPRYLVLRVRTGSLEFWTSDPTKPLLELSANAVSDVTLTDVADSNGVVRPTVSLAVQAPESRVQLPFLIMRNRGATALTVPRQDTERAVSAIQNAVG
jgi:hypothetical protein